MREEPSTNPQLLYLGGDGHLLYTCERNVNLEREQLQPSEARRTDKVAILFQNLAMPLCLVLYDSLVHLDSESVRKMTGLPDRVFAFLYIRPSVTDDMSDGRVGSLANEEDVTLRLNGILNDKKPPSPQKSRVDLEVNR